MRRPWSFEHAASRGVLAGKGLEGATLWLASSGTAPQQVRIDSVVVDPRDPEREVLLYRMTTIDPRTHSRTEVCGPDAEGERWGFPLQGQWDAEGTRVSDQGYTLTCADGAQGKCVRFGYKPWAALADGTSLAEYHQACVRLIRAAYCGQHGTTRDGMPIDIYDVAAIQREDPAAGSLGMTFEAAWTPDGAVCVAHTRVPANVTLDELAGLARNLQATSAMQPVRPGVRSRRVDRCCCSTGRTRTRLPDRDTMVVKSMKNSRKWVCLMTVAVATLASSAGVDARLSANRLASNRLASNRLASNGLAANAAAAAGSLVAGEGAFEDIVAIELPGGTLIRR